MKFSYYPDTDTLYIDLRYKPGADVLEIADDFVVDVDEDGVPVGMEIEHARQHTNLLHLKVEGPSLDLDLETSRSARAASSSRQTKTGPALEGGRRRSG